MRGRGRLKHAKTRALFTCSMKSGEMQSIFGSVTDVGYQISVLTDMASKCCDLPEGIYIATTCGARAWSTYCAYSFIRATHFFERDKPFLMAEVPIKMRISARCRYCGINPRRPQQRNIATSLSRVNRLAVV